jgi:putative phosphonate metabolism protein
MSAPRADRHGEDVTSSRAAAASTGAAAASSAASDAATSVAAISAGDAEPNWSAAARFAIYYAPPRTSGWWDAGSAWLGRDAESGAAYEARADFPPLSQTLARLTNDPRRYGWHGTLVAPFRLADGVQARDVVDVAQRWARTQTRFAVPVEAATLGRFVALRPAGDEANARMREVASSALRNFASLRAAPSAADLERRLAAPLTERQRALLVEWGYPYVFDEFRFHMTLSNSLEDARDRAAIVQWWHARVQQLGPLPVDGIALFVEPAPGEPFVLWQRIAFGAIGASGNTEVK